MSRSINTPNIVSQWTPADADRLDLGHVQRLAAAGLNAEDAWHHMSARERQHVAQIGALDLANSAEALVDEVLSHLDLPEPGDTDISSDESGRAEPGPRDYDAEMLARWDGA